MISRSNVTLPKEEIELLDDSIASADAADGFDKISCGILLFGKIPDMRVTLATGAPERKLLPDLLPEINLETLD